MLTKRDENILRLLDNQKYMSRWAIQRFLFNKYKNEMDAARKTNARLKMLVDCGYINRIRWDERNNNYVYFTDQKVKHWRQYAWINEIAALLRPYQYKHDYSIGAVIVDGLIVLSNGIKYIVEVDQSNNEFDKHKKLLDLAHQPNLWTNKWWATYQKLTPSFPRILILTFRKTKIEGLISQLPSNPLKWYVFNFSQFPFQLP